MRSAAIEDLESIRRIYNEGIEDRIATLDSDPKSLDDIAEWWAAHNERYAVIVAVENNRIVGWASLNRFSHRCAHAAVADLSVYIERSHRGQGIGYALLTEIEKRARAGGFHKIVLHASDVNEHGKRLYYKSGFELVGVFKEHGKLDGRYVDVIAMEKLLRPSVLFVCRHNTGRSQMAEAYLRHFAGNAVDVASAGTEAADAPNAAVVAVMAEDGIDISAARPKLIDPAIAKRADRIITMGCDVQGVPHIDDDWGLPDPKGQAIERVREIRDMVKEKARLLAGEILAIAPERVAKIS